MKSFHVLSHSILTNPRDSINVFEDYRGLILKHKVVNPGGRRGLSLLCELGGDSSQRKHGLRDQIALG